jgi:BirA family biotin operon repressor/biotin-[acetyl-CoA-carboxylase] ligase
MADPGALGRALAARGVEWPAPLEWHAQHVSTSDRLKTLARAGASEWTAVLADSQSGGRGREGRSWASPPGGLYLSILLRPRFAHASVLPLAAGVAVAEAVGEHGAQVALKWPNDVLLGGRKLAGILAESASGAGGLDWVALGIGVNAAVDVAGLPEGLRESAASLASAGGAPDVAALAASVLCRLRVWYDALAASPAAIVAAWRRRAVPWWGEDVELRTGAESLRGRLLDVDEDGALRLQLADGSARRVVSGEVARLRRAG